jgi:hypothetical protein
MGSAPGGEACREFEREPVAAVLGAIDGPHCPAVDSVLIFAERFRTFFVHSLYSGFGVRWHTFRDPDPWDG